MLKSIYVESIYVESVYVEKGPSERTTNLDGHELAAGELVGRPLVRLQCSALPLSRLEAVGSEAPQRGVVRGRIEAFCELGFCSLIMLRPRSSILRCKPFSTFYD